MMGYRYGVVDRHFALLGFQPSKLPDFENMADVGPCQNPALHPHSAANLWTFDLALL